jgi:hypothetical protein
MLLVPEATGIGDRRRDSLMPHVNRHALSLTADGRIQMLLPNAPLKDFGVPGAPKIDHRTVRHAFVESSDGGKTFRLKRPIPDDKPGTRYVPTLEKPTGHNTIAEDRNAALMYIEGLHRYPKKGEVIQNRLYYVELPITRYVLASNRTVNGDEVYLHVYEWPVECRRPRR